MCDRKKLDNVFYCQNTLWTFDSNPETPEQKAKLMEAIGFDGMEGFGYEDFFELKNALEKEGLSMPVNYVGLPFEADGKLDDTLAGEIKTMIESTAKGSVMYFHLSSNSYMDDKKAGDQAVSAILQELADYAAPFGVKLAVYPHIGLYCETLSHSVKLARMVDRENYGAVLNLCHLLKVEGTEGLEAKIEESTPYLFAVNICGADDGETREYGWDRLIQPLGEGSFDTYGFVKSLRDNGYTGPFGLQCYNLTGDVVEVLTGSMETWKEYKRRYPQENKPGS